MKIKTLDAAVSLQGSIAYLERDLDIATKFRRKCAGHLAGDLYIDSESLSRGALKQILKLIEEDLRDQIATRRAQFEAL